MSDILIRGMEMPSFGNETIIRIQPGGGILDQYGHHLDCEAVPIPPHGDLIDRDALIKQARTQFDWNDVVDVEDIANAPTIIPAEEGE